MGRLHLKWRKRPRLPQQTRHLGIRASSGSRGMQGSAAASGGPGVSGGSWQLAFNGPGGPALPPAPDWRGREL